MFKLSDHFINQYIGKQPSWGYGDLSYFVYKRTYAKVTKDGQQEEWWETCKRVIESEFNIQKDYCDSVGLPWDARKAQNTAQDSYRRMFEFKWLPPGRGIANMDYDKLQKLKSSAFLNNCAYICSSTIDKDFGRPFAWACDALMNGVGVGFSTLGAGSIVIQPPVKKECETFIIPDSREGWAQSVYRLLNSYVGKAPEMQFDYSLIRPAGTLLKTFGGTASGPQPLKDGHKDIRCLLDALVDKTITSTAIVDIMNIIARFVVAGGTRRSAQLALGQINDQDYIDMKNPDKYSDQLTSHRWASNNSIIVHDHDDIQHVINNITQNGEPGLFFVDNARHFARMKDGYYPDGHDKCEAEGVGVNPCSEQILESSELCVTGDTLLHTKDRIIKIRDLENQVVKIWNGVEWSKVQVVNTGRHSIYRVGISDGSYLDVTPGHEWIAKTKTEQKFKVRQTVELKPGMVLPKFILGKTHGGIKNDNAYQWGWVAGDGYIDGQNVMALVQEPEYAVLSSLGGKSRKPQKPIGYKNEFTRVNVDDSVPLHIAKQLRDHEADLPQEILDMDAESLANFFAGWVDTDGSIIRQANTDNLVLYGDQQKLRTAQILLRRIGINNASIHLCSPKGTITNQGIRNQDLWRMYIPSYESYLIPIRLGKIKRIGSKLIKNSAYKYSRPISRVRNQRITSVVKLVGRQTTFCFSEPLRHQAVFGNVLTKQCTLTELFPANHDSLEDFKKTLKVAYLYAKTVTLLPTHWQETNQIMIRNRRIGLSQSGIQQAIRKFGPKKYFKEFCDKAYTYVSHLDRIYSRWLGIPTSIRKTSIKPSGTISIVAGATPGVHCSHSEYYLRTVRTTSNDKLINALIKANYRIEISNTDKKQLLKAVQASEQDLKWREGLLVSELNQATWRAFQAEAGTIVIYFPVKEDNFTKSKYNISLWEQLTLVKELQYYWSDNSVSVTVTFKPEEANDLGYVIEYFRPYVKSLSFLPLEDHSYTQAPYISCSKEEYEEYYKSLKKLNLNKIMIKHHEEKYCNNDSCEV
jgi:hypothetical protein